MVHIDLADYNSVRQVVDGVDTIIHGGDTSHSTMHSAYDFYMSMLRDEIQAVFNVFHAAADAGCRRVVFLSTADAVAGNVYGQAGSHSTADDIKGGALRKLTAGPGPGYTLRELVGWRKEGVVSDNEFNAFKQRLAMGETRYERQPYADEWPNSRLELPPEHSCCPQNVYGAAMCWGEMLAKVPLSAHPWPTFRPSTYTYTAFPWPHRRPSAKGQERDSGPAHLTPQVYSQHGVVGGRRPQAREPEPEPPSDIDWLLPKADPVEVKRKEDEANAVAWDEGYWRPSAAAVRDLTTWTILQNMTLITSESSATRSLSIKWP